MGLLSYIDARKRVAWSNLQDVYQNLAAFGQGLLSPPPEVMAERGRKERQ